MFSKPRRLQAKQLLEKNSKRRMKETLILELSIDLRLRTQFFIGAVTGESWMIHM